LLRTKFCKCVDRKSRLYHLPCFVDRKINSSAVDYDRPGIAVFAYMEYRQGSHTTFKIEYHFVWSTKYRYQVLTGDVALRVRELVRQTCDRFDIHILRGVVSKDHVHILVSAPPNISPSDIMRWRKGRVARKVFDEFPHLKKRFDYHQTSETRDTIAWLNERQKSFLHNR